MRTARDEDAPDVDWLGPGPYAAGRHRHGCLDAAGHPPRSKDWSTTPRHPNGEDALPLAHEEGYPVVFFEHAGDPTT